MALIAAALVLSIPTPPVSAGQERPIDRLGRQPPLSSTVQSPANVTRDRVARQRLKSQIRRLELENRPGAGLSPTQRLQEELPRGPGLRAEPIKRVKKELNNINNLPDR